MPSEIFLTAAIWLFTLIFFGLACIKCKRVKIVPSVLVVFSVTFFSLLTPAGKVLLTIGRLKITQDSLLLGLRRSGILVGMVYLSRCIMSREFGKYNSKLTEVFYYLNLLTEKKLSFKKGHIIESIDERLCEIWENDTAHA